MASRWFQAFRFKRNSEDSAYGRWIEDVTGDNFATPRPETHGCWVAFWLLACFASSA